MKRQFDLFPYLLLLPAFVLIGTILVWPLMETFRLSFTNTSLRATSEYIGFANYVKIFESDFGTTMLRTLVWMSISVSLKLLFGLGGAVLLNAAIPGQSVFRVLLMPPWIVPVAIGAFMWSWMYNGQFGMISGVAQKIGLLDGPFEFLAYSNSAFMATIIADVWAGTPLVTLYLLAAMQAVPKELLEAAWADGASRRYRFRRITMPLIAPAFATIALLCVIWTINAFEIIWVMTEGGPRNTTTTMIVDSYKSGLARFRYGEGAARSVMILAFLSVFAVLYYAVLKRLSRKGVRLHD